MSILTVFSFDDQLIREQDGRWSVYDMIKVIGGQKNPHDAWKRLTVSYPEVLAKCEDWKFPGAGQRNTPVCDRQVALEIIGLLPGAVGKKYREEAAKLFLRYVDADITLADEIVQRQTDKKSVEWIQARVEGKVARLEFTDELKARGVTGFGYAANTDTLNIELFDHPAKELKEIKHVKNPRDGMTSLELAALRFAELKAIQEMKDTDAMGNTETVACSKKAGKVVRHALDN